MSEITRTLSASEVAAIQATLQSMKTSASTSATAFTFFAAFDGTNNDRSNVPLSRTPQHTNVGQIEFQVRAENPVLSVAGSKVAPNYYPGVGTGGETGGLMAAGPFPTAAVMATAQQALNDFAVEASAWLALNPGKTVADLSTAITGFSRGGATAIVFVQLLNEQGLKIGDNVIAAPGTVKVSAAILLDPVVTGIDRPMTLPSNMSGNVFVLRE